MKAGRKIPISLLCYIYSFHLSSLYSTNDKTIKGMWKRIHPVSLGLLVISVPTGKTSTYENRRFDKGAKRAQKNINTFKKHVKHSLLCAVFVSIAIVFHSFCSLNFDINI